MKGLQLFKRFFCSLVMGGLFLCSVTEANTAARPVAKTVNLFDTYSRMVQHSLDRLNPELAKIQLKRLDTYYKRIRTDIQRDGLTAQEQKELKKRIFQFQQIKSSVLRSLPSENKSFQDVQFFLENDKTISRTHTDSTFSVMGLTPIQSAFSTNLFQAANGGSQVQVQSYLQPIDLPAFASVSYVGGSEFGSVESMVAVEAGWETAIEFLKIPNVIFKPTVYVQQSDTEGYNQTALNFNLSKSVDDVDYSGGYELVAADSDASLFHRFFANWEPASGFDSIGSESNFEAEAESVILPQVPEASQVNLRSRFASGFMSGDIDTQFFTAFFPGEFEESHLGIYSEYVTEAIDTGVFSKWTLDLHGYVMTDQRLAKVSFTEVSPILAKGFEGSQQTLSMSLDLDAREGYSHGFMSWGFVSPFETTVSTFQQVSGSLDRYQSLSDRGSYSMLTLKKDVQSLTDATQQQYRVAYRHYDERTATYFDRLTVGTAFVTQFNLFDKTLVGSIDLSHDFSMDASRESETMLAFKCDVLFGSL